MKKINYEWNIKTMEFDVVWLCDNGSVISRAFPASLGDGAIDHEELLSFVNLAYVTELELKTKRYAHEKS